MKESSAKKSFENNNATNSTKSTKSSKKIPGSFWHINRKTLPLKITLFLYYGAMSALLPYLTIHMKDIGISLSQIGIIYAVLPFTAFIGPAILGILADKFGQYKACLIVSAIITGVAHTLLLLVPRYSETPVHSQTLIEFNRGQYFYDIPIVLLRPSKISQCRQFMNSLDNNNSSFFHVHSCKWGDGGNHSNPLASRVIKFWNIPTLCRQDLSKLQFTCGNDHTGLFSWSPINSNSFLNKPEVPPIPDTRCSIPVQLNGYEIGQGVQQQVTCHTNWTYPTGETEKTGNPVLTFWLYFLIRIIGNSFMNSCFNLLVATTLVMVKMNKGSEFGRERIFSVLGLATISPLAGLLVDSVSSSKGYTDYSPAFFISNGMLILTVIGLVFMKLKVEKPSEGSWRESKALLKYPEVIVFLLMIFFMGNLWGFIESYLFIFLDELDAPKYLLGLTLTVGSLAGIPFLYGSEWIVGKLGRANLIAFAFVVYFVRLFGYSYIPNPFWCFPFEAMEALTYHLMWVAAATYCAVLSPKGLLGTVTGVAGSLHYGLGKGSGAFIGGYVIGWSSTREAFRYVGVFAGGMGVIYFLLNLLWLERAIRKRKEKENAVKDSNSGEIKDNEEMESMLNEDSNSQAV